MANKIAAGMKRQTLTFFLVVTIKRKKNRKNNNKITDLGKTFIAVENGSKPSTSNDET